ncbi:MAG: hypothetical protein AAGB00_01330 [Planctomycetota bacterium]
MASSKAPLVAESRYRLWVPDDTQTISVVFVVNMRAAGKHLFYRDLEWREMAVRNSAAMMYCEFEAKGVRGNGYGLSILAACNQFGAALGRPELKHVPLVLWGHSMGGRVTQDFVRFMPSRVLAFHIALRSNPSTKGFMVEEAKAMRVPGLYLMGAQDRKPKDIREHFVRAREAGSPRAWVWLPGQTHWPAGMYFDVDETTPADWRAWAANDVVIPWTEAMIKLRLPRGARPARRAVKLRSIDVEEGWLASANAREVSPYAEFAGDKGHASWFPSEEVAGAWAAYSSPAQAAGDGGLSPASERR